MDLILRNLLKQLISQADYLTKLDQVVGDGDLGISIQTAGNYILGDLSSYPLHDYALTFHRLAIACQDKLGGSSGPLYSVFLLKFSSILKMKGDKENPSDPKVWAEAFQNGIKGISDLGDAKEGDRTMLDALIPASRAFSKAIMDGKSIKDALHQSVIEAQEGVKATSQILAKRGRSSYLGERVIGHIDPGAEAVTIIIKSINETIQNK